MPYLRSVEAIKRSLKVRLCFTKMLQKSLSEPDYEVILFRHEPMLAR
jgi:hypothetical protein